MTSPLTFRLPASLLVAALLVVGVGCDFTRVDEGADAPLQTHLEALATASTSDDAEQAIRGALNKVGVRTSWQADVPAEALAFGSYEITDTEIETLARQHAEYVSGQAAGTTLGEMHRAVVEADNRAREILLNMDIGVTPVVRGEIMANADEAAAVLGSEAVTALRSPEHPSSALALLVAASGSSLPTEAGLSSARDLSPAQRLLYTVWLHHNGPFIHPFLSDEAAQANARTAARTTSGSECDACCGGGGKFTDITFQYTGTAAADVEVLITSPPQHVNGFVPFPEMTIQPNGIFTASAAGRTNAPGGFVGTLGNEIELYVNGDEIDYAPFGDPNNPDANTGSIHTSCSELVLPGDVYGDFTVIAVATQDNGLCSDLETCVGACQARRSTCEASATTPQQLEVCRKEFVQCDQNCHDQGGIGI